MPKIEILEHLYPIFFARMGSLFPSLSLPFLESLNSSNSYSQHSLEGPVLASAVCALAARFSTSPLIRGSDESRPPATYGVPFAEKAKALLLPLLCFPSGITITTLLLLSYHEKGMNSEGSQWMYLGEWSCSPAFVELTLTFACYRAGMSIRMAQDLGLQLVSARHESENRQGRVDLASIAEHRQASPQSVRVLDCIASLVVDYESGSSTVARDRKVHNGQSCRDIGEPLT